MVTLRKKTKLSWTMLALLFLGVLAPLFRSDVEPVKAAGAATVDMSPLSCFHRVGYHWQNYDLIHYDGENPLSAGWYYPSPESASGPWQPETPLIFDLKSNGFNPDDFLVITYNYSLIVGYWWAYYSGISISTWQSYGQFNATISPNSEPYPVPPPLYGVFSSSDVVDPDFTNVQRVPGAIDAGEDSHSGTATDIYGGFQTSPFDSAQPLFRYLDTDIPEDFKITPYYGFEIKIPQGAKYIILGIMPGYVGFQLGLGPIEITFEKDSDGDGLLDSWEQDGIDVDKDGTVDLDLPMMGADWQHKDAFVEVDYMGSIANCTGHRPNEFAMADVKNAFANSPVPNPDGVNGVNLHILVDEELPHVDVLAGAAGWTGFNSTKHDHFGTVEERSDPNAENILEAKKWVYHYCLFVHQRQDRNGGGVGELPGNDFMVSLADWGDRNKEAATFMHELGHNLGLQHGGGDDINYKPNYLSIMNYLFEFDGSPVTGRPLDYSVRQLSDLNENTLNEVFGIGGLPGDKTAFSLPNLNVYNGTWFLADGSQGIDGSTGLDWNGNGTIDGGGTVWANVNNFPQWNYASAEGETLKGYNDWANLNFCFRSTSGYDEGVHPQDTDDELAPETIQSMHEAGMRAQDTTKPTAEAGQDKTVNIGATVSFDAGTSSDNVGIVSYEWDFGDGATGTGQTATHTYANTGTYTVTLTIRDAAGNTANDTITVTVLSTEAFPTVWIAGTAVAVIAIATAAILLIKRRK